MYLSWNITSLKTESGFASHWHAVSMTHLLNVMLVPGCSSCFLWLYTIKHLLNKNTSWKLNKLSLCLKHLRSVGKKAKETASMAGREAYLALAGFTLVFLSSFFPSFAAPMYPWGCWPQNNRLQRWLQSKKEKKTLSLWLLWVLAFHT